MLEVVVSDTGRGIESSQLETIFDRFSQSENYLRRTTNGVGLGLVKCGREVKVKILVVSFTLPYRLKFKSNKGLCPAISY